MSAEKNDENLLIVRSCELGTIAKLSLWRDKDSLGLESVIELFPYYQLDMAEETYKLLPFLYITLLKEYSDKGYPGLIEFLKSEKFDQDTGLIDTILTTKINEIFKYIVVRKAISIESACLDFEELYAMKDKVREITEGLEVLDNWLKTQRVLYLEEFKNAADLCVLSDPIKERYKDVVPTPFPILNCSSIALYRDMYRDHRKEIVDKIINSEKYNISQEVDAKLYKQLEGFYADKDKFFNILREMYLFIWSPYDHLDGLFKFKVYKTLDGVYTIVNCRNY